MQAEQNSAANVVALNEASGATMSFSFGQAVEFAKQGKLVTRMGWNGKGMFIFMRPGDRLPADILIGVRSLPLSVKSYFENKHRPISENNNPQIEFTPYLCMKAADDTIVNGWLASQTDMLSTDWILFGF